MGNTDTDEYLALSAAEQAHSAVSGAAHYGVVLDYTPESVRLLEDLLSRKGRSLPEALITDLAAYYGETIRLTLGGSWKWFEDEDGREGVLFGVIEDRDTIFPINKVWKRIRQGKDHDVAYFYDTLVTMKREADARGTYPLLGDIVKEKRDRVGVRDTENTRQHAATEAKLPRRSAYSILYRSWEFWVMIACIAVPASYLVYHGVTYAPQVLLLLSTFLSYFVIIPLLRRKYTLYVENPAHPYVRFDAAVARLFRPLSRRQNPPAPAAADFEVVEVSTVLSEEFGTQEEHRQVWDLEDALDKVLRDAGAGDCDGDLFGGGRGFIYLYGPDADRVFELVRPILEKSELKPMEIRIRRGHRGDPLEGEVALTI
jgi:hypothetical protein